MVSNSSTTFYESVDLPHDDKRRSTMISIWCLAGLSLVFLVTRLLCKLCTRRRLWWDDHVMILSWIVMTASVGLSTWSITQGEGLHVWDVNPAHLGIVGELGNWIGTFSILGAVWSKTSFALTLLRLVSTTRMRAAIWVAIVSMNVAMCLNAVFLWVRCMPLDKTWNPQIPGTCWAPQVYPIYGIFAAGYSAIMDFVLALLPWKIVWPLQMRNQEKFGVAIAMSLGVVAGIMAIVKTSQIPELASGDFSYASIPLIVWGVAESAVTIMAASIPVLRVLLRDATQLTRRRYQMSTAASYIDGGNGMHSAYAERAEVHTRKDGQIVFDDERALRSVSSQQTVCRSPVSLTKEPGVYSIRVVTHIEQS